jgi:serine/threonine-protein kinase
MTPTNSVETVLDNVRKSGLVRRPDLDKHLSSAPQGQGAEVVLAWMVKAGLLTAYQAKQLLLGKVKGFFLGPYKVLRPIGKGGMGTVYLAEHTDMGRQVALKVLTIANTDQNGAVERFRREARASAAVDHRNIVRAFDLCVVGRYHFLVMEYVDGKNLREVLDDRARLPWHEAAGYILQAAQGLQHAFERGLVHRDIKPSNILLGRDGVVKILDLGLARFLDDERHDGLTARLGSKSVLGTAEYISPEALCGDADIRSDIYGLGATLYTLIEGQPPFPRGNQVQKYLAHKTQIAPLLHTRGLSVPEGLSAAVARMLAKSPDDRPQTPAEVVELLLPWTTPPRAEPAEKPQEKPQEPQPLWSRVAEAMRSVVSSALGWLK